MNKSGANDKDTNIDCIIEKLLSVKG